jgi:hypothetical protein
MPRKASKAMNNNPSNGGDKPSSKKEAVRRALAAGVDSPTEMVGWIKDKFNMDITPGHAKTAKGTILRGRKGGKGKRGRKGRRAGRPAQAPAAVSRASEEAGLSPQELRGLVELAHRVGGIDQLKEFLDVLRPTR